MIASGQGRGRLFPAHVRGRMDIGSDPRTLGGVPFLVASATLLEATIMLVAMVLAARWVIRQFEVRQTPPAHNRNRFGGARGIDTRRNRGRRNRAGAFLSRLFFKLSDCPRHDFTGHVPDFFSDAVSRHAINTWPRRSNLLSFLVHAKGRWCGVSASDGVRGGPGLIARLGGS